MGMLKKTTDRQTVDTRGYRQGDVWTCETGTGGKTACDDDDDDDEMSPLFN
jgi:hypothetical protein